MVTWRLAAAHRIHAQKREEPVRAGAAVEVGYVVFFFFFNFYVVMKSVVITGGNRGIGLGLVKQLLKSSECVIATCRTIEKSVELKKIADENSNVHVLQLDVVNFDGYNHFIGEVENIVGSRGLNVLINNAGIATKFTRINLVKAEQMIENFKTNTVAPLMLTKALYPLLKRASQVNNDLPMCISRAAVVNVSSILGSIQENIDGGFYPYRVSKAGLNAITKSMSIDLKGDQILVISMHPGWCKTNLGGKNAPLEVENAVSKLINTLFALKENDTGSFIQYDGQLLTW